MIQNQKEILTYFTYVAEVSIPLNVGNKVRATETPSIHNATITSQRDFILK